MTNQPYDQDDLRAEAARQHSSLVEDTDFVGVGEQMEGQEVTPGGGVTWGDFSEETYDRAQREIHELITKAADLSQWSVQLGADGLEPDSHFLQLGVDPGTGDKPRVRIQFAFAPEMTGPDRDAFVVGLSKVIAENL